MYELLEASIHSVNLPYTILLVLMLLYWMLYLLGVVSSETLDAFDFDLDVDVDPDIDVDANAGAHGGGLVAALQFFYVGQIPIMLIYSLLILNMWVLSVMGNHWLSNTAASIALLLAIPIFIGGLICTRLMLMPFAPFLIRLFDESGDDTNVVGMTCTVTSLEVTPKYGQAECALKAAPIILNVVCKEGETLKKGDTATVVAHDAEEDRHLITKL